jgi:DNA-binding PadR family transcriptional regulator
METSIKKIGRELLSNGGVSQTDLRLSTKLPSWKISRFFKRLELLEFIEVEKEPRFTRGRPRKIAKLTPNGIEYFTSLLGETCDEPVLRKSRGIYESSAEGAKFEVGI